MVDYYAVLQLPPDADDAAIEAAFAKLSRAYDASVLAGVSDELRTLAEQRVFALTQAHAVLADPTLRAAYDAGLTQVVAKALATAEPTLDYRPLPAAGARERIPGFVVDPQGSTLAAGVVQNRTVP